MGGPRRDDEPTVEDELWDPGAQQRDLLAMTVEERLEIVAALFAQSNLFPPRDREPR